MSDHDHPQARANSADRPTSKSLLGGAGTLMARRYAIAAMGWISTVIIVRELTPEDWGAFSFVFSLAGILGILSDLNIGRIVLRGVMADQSDSGRTIGSYVAMRTLLGLASAGLALVIVVVGNYPADVVHTTAIAAAVLVVSAVAASLELVFVARLWMRDLAYAGALGKLAQLGLVALLAFSGHATMVWFAVPAVLFPTVEVAWQLLRCRHLIEWNLSTTMWWPWIREAIPLAIGATAAAMYIRIDIVMLSQLDDLTAVGIYSVGYKFSGLMGSMGSAVTAPLLTVLIAALPHDLPRFARAFRQALLLLLVAGVGATIAFGAFAEPIISLLYGSRYEVGARSAQALVFAQGLNLLTLLCFTLLVSVGRHRRYAVATVSGLALNVGLNLVLIPAHSFNGAAAATIITELAVLAVLVSGTVTIAGVSPLPWASMGKIAAAGLVMTAVVVAVGDLVAWPVALGGAGAVYLVALHVLRPAGPGGLRALAEAHGGLPQPQEVSS